MNIAVIGTGRVGKALGSGWAAKGHRVTFASRDPQGEKALALLEAAGPNAACTTLAEAVAQSEVVVLAVPWSAVEETLAAAGDLSGKVLIDAVNAIAPGLRQVFGPDTSSAQHVATLAPGAAVVKAFNTTGSENMADPDYNGQAATMFICGDDPAAKAVVTGLVEDLGFECVDAGPLAAARHLEALARVWIHLATVQGYGRNIAFKLLRR